jgi:hypothetical protein
LYGIKKIKNKNLLASMALLVVAGTFLWHDISSISAAETPAAPATPLAVGTGFLDSSALANSLLSDEDFALRRMKLSNYEGACTALKQRYQGIDEPSMAGPSDVGIDDLAFIHIPKTGGTSIESAEFITKGRSNATYRPFSAHNMPPKEKDRFCRPLGVKPAAYGPLCRCSLWHVPPNFVPAELSWFANRRTWCIARDPFDRALSEYKMKFLRRNNTASYRHYSDAHTASLYFVNELRKDIDKWGPWGFDCHLAPQYAYIWSHRKTKAGALSTATATEPPQRRVCHDVLRYSSSHFAESFDALIARYAKGRGSVRLQSMHMHMHHRTTNLTAADVPENVAMFVRLLYWKDTCLLGLDLRTGRPLRSGRRREVLQKEYGSG